MLQKSYPRLLLTTLKRSRRWLTVVLMSLLIASSSFLALPHLAYTAEAPPPYLLQWGSGGSGNGQFVGPAGIAVDGGGNVYVADHFNQRIQKFTSTGDYLLQWGTAGKGNGQFNYLMGIVVDSSGNVYVADYGNDRIQKFDSTGNYLLQWGTQGSDNGQFLRPHGVTVDSSGNVYVVDQNNHRIQKFDSTGNYLLQWGTQGSDNGQFSYPGGVAVDRSGNVYIADAFNDRVQEFDSNGHYLTQWGSVGSGDGQFAWATEIAVDSSGNIYVTDQNNYRVQKFTSSGSYLTQWGAKGSGNGQFGNTAGIAVDSAGNIYVSDYGNNRIQEFGTPTEVPPPYLLQWGTLGSGNGQFNYPAGVAVDKSSNVYVAEHFNNRIQMFTNSGGYLLQWGKPGSGNGEFNASDDVVVDGNRYVYVADAENYRIQKFTRGGDYLLQWGTKGSSNGQFDSPGSVTVDSYGNVYVAEFINSRVQKFDGSGAYLTQWGTKGSSNGQFYYASGVVVDSSGNVYVADYFNHRIQKFDSNGTYLLQWGTFGNSKGQFHFPAGLAVDSSGNVYVADSNNHRIQKFTGSGAYLTQWGTYGSGNGQFSYPSDVAVDSSGNVYVADFGNHRIQKFGPPVTKLTVMLDAQPLQSLNFRFSGDLGAFKLRDKKANDEKQMKTVTVSPGTYTVAEQVPAGWYLDIACTPAGSGVVNLATSSVAINVANGQEVTCVFTNQQSALVRVLKYNDRNSNHKRNGSEPYLSGWTMDLYDNQNEPAPIGYTQCADEGQRCDFTGTKDVAYGANGVFYYRKAVTDGIDCTNDVFGDPFYGVVKACYIKDSRLPTLLIGRQVTNKHGKASFTNVRPGLLTICEIQQAGWFNSQPNSTDYTYGQPCYTQNVLPGMTATFKFGNTTTPPESPDEASMIEEGKLLAFMDTTAATATEVDEDAYPAPVTDDVFLNTPEPETQVNAIYLPFISQ